MSAAKVSEKSEINIKLSVIKGPHSGQVFFINKPSFTVGRGAENDIILMNDPLISRLHAQLDIVDRDLEIKNLSGKNAVVVEGEIVQQWKIVNNSHFTIGDSELLVEYDFGKAVAVVSSAKKSNVVTLKSKSDLQDLTPLKIEKPLGPPNSTLNKQLNSQLNNPISNQASNSVNNLKSNQRHVPNSTSSDNSKFIFYLIGFILIGGLLFVLLKSSKGTKAKKTTSVLKYEDVASLKAASLKEMEREADREGRLKDRERSPQDFRIRESFVRGMRDFQLGNYARAQESFQLILNLDPAHALAKRYFYLSKVRFDEIVQEKLMLGESYFKKHNFSMCESLYRQVINMLNGKNGDPKMQLALKKARQCQLAAEGIQ